MIARAARYVEVAWAAAGDSFGLAHTTGEEAIAGTAAATEWAGLGGETVPAAQPEDHERLSKAGA